MEKIYLDDNIFCIKNFLDKETFDTFLKYANQEEKWYFHDSVIAERGKKYIDEPKDEHLWLEFEKKIHSLFDENLKYLHTRELQVFDPSDPNNLIGDEWVFGVHQDDSGYKKYIKVATSDKVIHFGCILYLNNNFSGGELVYPQKNITINPEPNMLVVHPASDDYEHGVKKVFGAKRYTIPGFMIDKKYL